MGCLNNFILGYFRLFNIKHLRKCTQSSGSFHKCSNDLRPTVLGKQKEPKFFGNFMSNWSLFSPNANIELSF